MTTTIVRRYILEPTCPADLDPSRQDWIDRGLVRAYVADLRLGRPLAPIVTTPDLVVLDGFHRHVAALRLGLAEIWVAQAEGTHRSSIWIPEDHGEVFRTRGDR